MLPDWLKNWVKGRWGKQWSEQGGAGKRRRRLRSFRPELLALEERLAPAIRVWDGGGGSANWSDAANWSGDVAPASADDLLFPDVAAQKTNTNDFAAGTLFHSLRLSGGGYLIGGNGIQLYAGLSDTSTAGSNNVFNVGITLLNAETFVVGNFGRTLTLGDVDTGNLLGSTNVIGTSALTVDGGGTLEIGGVLGGQGSLFKQGAGTLILSGPNTYAGLTQVQQGVLNIRDDSALGSALAGTTVAAGASLQVEGGITVAEPLAIAEGGVGFGAGTDPSTLGALRSVGGSNTWIGGIQLTSNSVIGVDAGSVLTIDAAISADQLGGRQLNKVGPGVLQFTGNQSNTYTGTTTVLQGTLELNKTGGALPFQGALTVGDNIGGDNSAVVRLLQDEQIPRLDFFNTTLNTVTVNSSGLLNLNNQSDVIGHLLLVNGPTFSADVTTGTGTLTLTGNVTVNGFQGSSPASPAATISGRLALGPFFSGAGGGTTHSFIINNTALASVDQDLVITADISGAAEASLTKAGAGVLTLSGNNSYAGPTILTNGIVRIGSDTAFGTGLLSIQNNAVVLRAVGSRTIGNAVSIDSNFAVRGPDNLTFAGAATLTGSRIITVLNPAQVTTFSGGIGEGVFGSQPLTKAGQGTLALTGVNTYSGTTTINSGGGTLLVSGGGTLLNSSSFTINDGGTLRIDNTGQPAPIDRLNDLAGVSLSGGELAFIGSAGAPSETVGVIILIANLSSSISSSSAGGPAQLIGNALIVGGGATVQFEGIGDPLSAAGPNRISFINTPVAPTNGILPFARVEGPLGAIDFATYASVPEGIGIIPLPASGYVTDINLAGPTSNVRLAAGVHNLSMSRTINALFLEPGAVLNGADLSLTVGSGAVIVGDGGASSINVSTLSLPAAAFVTVAGSATAAINSTIVGAVTSITKAGSGNLVLTGDNQFAGTLNLNGGTVNVQRSTALGATAGATTVRQGAVLELEETTFGPVQVATETLNLTGTGIGNGGSLRNVAGAANSWAGAVVLTGVSLDGPSFFPSTNVLVISGVVIDVAAGALNLSGVVSGAFGGIELIKIGAGTLELSGVASNSYSGATRVKEGRLLLNKVPGLTAAGTNAAFFIGDDDGVGAPAILELAGSDQITDGAVLQVGSTGQVDLQGFSEVVAGLVLTVGPSGASDVLLGGGLLTLNGNVTVQQIGGGVGNLIGATIQGGTLALQLFGGATTTRTFLVNDAATGDDLTITSSIVDGSGLANMAVTKTGFGTMVLGGSSANTYTGTTTVNEGELALDKTGGNALSGPLTIGNNTLDSGFAGSDVVQLRQGDQLPDFVALVTINTTGLLDLATFNVSDTIGTADAQTALTMQGGSTLATGSGTLSINGNIAFSAATGVALYTVVAPPTLSGNLDLGAISRIVDVADRGELAIDAILSANISGSGGLVRNNNGFLLLSGNNTYAGDTFVNTTANGIAVGSDTALGTGRLYFLTSNASILSFGGTRAVANETFLPAARTQFGYWNDLTFTGPVNGVGGTITANTVNSITVEFQGGIGETFGGTALTKEGFGTLVLSGVSTYSGTTTINANGGSLVLRDQGTALNSNFVVGQFGNLIIDNDWGANLLNRLGDNASITLTGGTFTFIGKTGQVSSEKVGTIALGNNFASAIQSIVSPLAGSSATLTFGTLARTANQGATVTFMGRGVDLGDTTANQIVFVTVGGVGTGVGLDDGIIRFATILNSTGFEFASHTNTLNNNVLRPLLSGANFSTTLAGATATVNVKLSASENIGANTSVNALLLAGGGIIVGETAAATLTIASGLLASSGAGNQVNTTTLTLAAEGIVAAAADLTISSIVAGAASALAKSGFGTLILAGAAANTFAGTTIITQGRVNVRKDQALGTAAGTTTVVNLATLELEGPFAYSVVEALSVAGAGLGGIGAFRNVSGDHTWRGNVTIAASNTVIDVAGGTALQIGSAADPGVVAFGNNLITIKTGAGALELSGTGSNTFTNNPSLFVHEGTLRLNKLGGAVAVPANLFVGDHVGGDDADQVVFLGSNQITATRTVTVTSSGLFNLNGQAQTFGPYGAATNAITLFVGPLSSGDIQIGAGTLALVRSATAANVTNVLVNVLGGGTPQAAQITSTGAGRLTLQNLGASSVGFNVSDSAALEDLIVSAAVADGAGAGGLVKSGNGRLVLSGANSYSGTTSVTAGELSVQSNTALGAVAGDTVVSVGAALQLQGGVTIAGESLSLAGTGTAGQFNTGVGSTGPLRSLSGANTWAGNITLGTANTSNTIFVGVDAGSLTIDGAISQFGANAFGLTKTLPGDLVFTGGAANTYTGTTTVNEGALVLSKSAGVNAIAGSLVIGNDAGGNNADLVRFDANEQIANTAAVTVNSSGRLHLNNTVETLGAATALDLRFGTTYSGNVDSTGAGGQLVLNGNVNAAQAAGTTPVFVSPAALITGNLDLGAATRSFTVALNAFVPRELEVDAALSNGALSKAGAGALALVRDNSVSYTGTTTLTAGTLVVGDNNALGTGVLNVTGAGTIRAVAGGSAVILPNDVNLNANLTVAGDRNFTFGGLVTQVGAARTISITMNVAASADFAGGISLGDLALNANTFTLSINTSTFNSTHSVSGVINDGAATNGGLTKLGGGTLLLSNANTYDGTTTVSGGILRITAAGALGSTAGNTVVNANATLAVAGNLTVAEPLNLNGNVRGFGVEGGALRSTADTNTWTGNITLGNANGHFDAIGVDLGSTLIVSGQIVQSIANVGLIKVGEGTLRLAGGATANTYVGATIVRAGTLELDMNDGTNAFAGALTVGDEGGGPNADRVVLLNNNQIPAVTVTVASSGQLDLGGFSDAIGALTLNGTLNSAGNVALGGGTLTLGGTVTLNNFGFSDGSSPAATIDGGTLALGANRIFNVNDSVAPNAAEDLVVSAVVSGAFTLTKQLFGTMALTAANLYTGATTVNAGTFAGGATAQLGGTLVLRDGGTVANVAGNSFTVNAGAALVLDNTGDAAPVNRIFDTAAITLAGGTLSFIGSELTPVTENVGAVTVNAGASSGSTIVSTTQGGNLASLTGTTLSRGVGATLHLIGVGADLGSATNEVRFTTSAPFDANGILPFATISGLAGFDLVTDADPGAQVSLGRVLVYANDINTPNGIVKFTGAGGEVRTLAADNTIGALLLDGNGLTVDGGFRLTVGAATAGLVVNRGGSNSIATTNIDFAGREPLFLVESGSTLEVSANLVGTAALRKERTGSLILSGDNDQGTAATRFTGLITVNEGRLVARHSDSFGTAAGGVTVNNLAALLLDGALTIGNETLNVAGAGLNGDGTGALRATGGTSTWGTGATAAAWNANPTIVAVDAGSDLVLNATVGTGGNGLTKVGLGTLELGGTASNSFTGTTTVNEGTLRLNKSGAALAIANGSLLVIGDFAGTDRVEYAPTAGTSQIGEARTQPITINSGGVLDLNGIDDVIGRSTAADALIFNGGGVVSTGTGTLTLGGTGANVTYNAGSQATISGNLNLNGGARTFAVNDGAAVDDLVISAVISNGSIIKSNVAGTLLLDAVNLHTDTTLAGGVLALGTNDALGAGTLTINTAASTLRSKDGTDLTGANAIANAIVIGGTGITLTLGGQRDFGGTSGLELSGPVTLPAPGAAATRTIAVADPLAFVEISGDIGGGSGFLTLSKAGIGTLVLSGNNNYTGTTAVSAGVLNVRSATALGATTQGTTVASGAVLELEGGVLVGAEALALAGQGLLTRTGDPSSFTGALRNVSGNNTWGTGATAITLAAATYVSVDLDQLTLNGTVSGAFALNKVGGGTLELAGTANNTFTGTTTVFEGTLSLNKAGAIALPGALVVGDNVGAPSSDIVRFAAGATDNQIAAGTGVTISVQSTGWLDLNDRTNTLIGPAAANSIVLTLVIGSTSSGRVTTGAGTLHLHSGASTTPPVAGVLVNVRPGIATAVSAEIAGNLALLGTAAAAGATRVFTVNDSPAADDLVITANIVDGAAFAGALTKAGAGLLVLDPAGASTYSGTVSVNAGVLNIRKDTALGAPSAPTASNVVASGAALEMQGNLTIAGEGLQLNGSGIINGPITALGTTPLGTGALRSVSGTSTWTGNVHLNTNPAAVAVDAGQLSLSGIVGGANGGATVNGLVKAGAGTLEFSGAAGNTYTGTTTVNTGTLLLNKSGAAVAVGGPLVIGDNVGGDDADVVRYALTAGTNQIGDVAITVNSSGLLDLNGISDTINSTLVLGVGPTFSGTVSTGAGTYTLNNTIFAISQAGTTTATPAAVISGNVNMSVTRIFDVREGNAPVELDVSAAIAANGNVTKASRGTLRLSGNNTYAFATIMNADSGTLLADTPATVAVSAYTINAGSTLGGTGQINGTVTLATTSANLLVGGILSPGGTAPGATVDILTVNNNVTFNARSLFFVEINDTGVVPGVDFDQLNVIGAGRIVTINAVGTLVAGVTGGNPINGSSYVLINMADATGTIAGNFSNAVPPSPPAIVTIGGKSYSFTYVGNIDANDFVLTAEQQTRVWDGGSPIDNNWTSDANWVGDQRPFGGDNLVFNDIGVVVRNNPFNDFPAGTFFDTITLDTTLGSYTLDGNALLLSEAGGGITNVQGTNTINLGLSTGTNPQTITVTAGSLDLNGAVTLGADLTLAGAGTGRIDGDIGGGSNLVKQDTGTFTLGGANNTFTGTTTVNGGLLLIDGTFTLSAGPGSAVTVNSGATLGGIGSINRQVNIASGGTLSPGNPTGFPGTLTVGDLTPTALVFVTGFASTHDIQLNGLASFDQVVVNGGIDLGDVTLNATLGFVPAAADSFIIFDNDGMVDAVSGTLSGVPNNGFISIGGVVFQVHYDGGDGNDVELEVNSAPVLNTAVNTTLNAINEDEPSATNIGTTVDAIVATAGLYSDFNGVPPAGIALTGINNTNGTWEYSIDGGGSWNPIGLVSDLSALLLTADGAGLNRVRFVPSLNFSGTSTSDFRGWDTTDGNPNNTAGVDVSTNGGFTAYSFQTEIAVIDVIAVADAPNLAVTTPANGQEDTAIPLTITASLNDIDGSETLSITITGVPAGATLSAGTDNGGGVWTLTPAELVGLTITPPLNSDVDFTLQVSATATESSNSDTATTGPLNLDVVVDAVADVPNLTVAPAAGDEDTAIPLTITTSLNDTDGSETLTITISNVPLTAVLQSGTFGPATGSSSYVLTPADLAGLTITPPPNSDVDFTLQVTATATEAANGDTADNGPLNLLVTVNAVADTPNLSVTTPANGQEDTPIPLTITASLNDTDGSEVLTITITGVPAGAALSAGTNNGGGVWTLTPGQLAGLSITPPLHSDIDFTLQVTATARELDNNDTASIGPFTLDVVVDAVADQPNLTAPAAVSGGENTVIAVPITSSLVDTDGSESLTITLSNLPTTLIVRNNLGNVFTGSTSYVLTPAQLAGLNIRNRDNIVFTMVVTATATEAANGDTASRVRFVNVNIFNTPPVAGIFGPRVGAAGQRLVFTLRATDRSPLDQAANFRFFIDWNGDGRFDQTVIGPSGTRVAHIYTTAGRRVIRMKARDKDGGTSAVVRKPVTISNLLTQVDPTNPNKTALNISGTTGNDIILVRAFGTSRITVARNGVNLGSFPKPTGHIIIFGQAGNDRLELDSRLNLDAILDGGTGNDLLIGGAGEDILLGGPGADTLIGNGSNNLLIGGTGRDQLWANNPNTRIVNRKGSILIGGTTDYDTDLRTLDRALRLWAAGQDTATFSGDAVNPDNAVDTLNYRTIDQIFAEAIDRRRRVSG